MKIKVLIIGNGFVGKSMYNYLLDYVDSVLDIKQICGLEYTSSEIDNRLADELNNSDYKYIINCVGYTGYPNVDACEDNKEITKILNVDWPKRLATYCGNVGVKLINISSGCIYDGYDKIYTENDTPNFGVNNPLASWYSKTKHMCEMELNNLGVFNFRIRMPISDNLGSCKNYLSKILKYNDLVNLKNSKTVMGDLFEFIYKFIVRDDIIPFSTGNYNVVNPEPLSTSQIVDILDNHNLWNPHHKYISLEKLHAKTACRRSNCILSTNYLEELGFGLPKEEESVIKMLSKGFIYE